MVPPEARAALLIPDSRELYVPEREKYADASIIVLGGTSGTGRETVARFKSLGARSVFVGTSNAAHFADTKEWIEDEYEMDMSEGVYPFVAPVQDRAQLRTAAREARRIGGGENVFVVVSHADGMFYMKPLFDKHIFPIFTHIPSGKTINDISESEQAVVRAMMVPMREDIEQWSKEAIPQAVEINYQGTVNALEECADVFEEGFTGVVRNSTWGKLSGKKLHGQQVEIPRLYLPVDHSKAMVRDLLQRYGSELAANNIYLAEETSSLIRDTKVGKIFVDFFLRLMAREQAEAIRSSSVLMKDTVNATQFVFENDPRNWATYPLDVFVFARDGVPVIESQLDSSLMYSIPYQI